MLLAHRQPVLVPPHPGGTSSVQLLIREDGQLHELPFGRTTVGSSPKCNLRLELPGVQPLHCLIVHGPEGVSVRRWAADAWLNGAQFDDAPLVAGDCLAIGGVELELVQAADEGAAEETSETFSDEPHASCYQLMDAVQESVDAITDLETELDQELDQEADQETNQEAEQETDQEAEQEADQEFVADFEWTPVRVERPPSEAAEAEDAAEIVFRELQAACTIARGRARRMLAALRNERQQNHELLEQLNDIGDQLALLDHHPSADDSAVEAESRAYSEWQTQWDALRQQFATWEARLVEHTQQMAELQQELIAVRDSQLTASELTTAERASGTTVESAVEPLASHVAESESTTRPEESSDAVQEITPANEPQIEFSGEPISAVRKSLWVEAGIPRLDESTLVVQEELPLADEAATVSDPPEEQWVAPPKEEEFNWSQSAATEPPTAENSSVPAASDTDPWILPTVDSERNDYEPNDGLPSESVQRKSLWSVPPLPESEETSGSGGLNEANDIEVDAPAWASGSATEAEPNEDAVSPFAEFSIRKQGEPSKPDNAAEFNDKAEEVSEPPADVSAVWGTKSSSEDREVDDIFADDDSVATAIDVAPVAGLPTREAEASETAVVSPRKSQPASFIDRYSHLFKEGAASDSDTPSDAPAERPAAEVEAVTELHATGIARDAGDTRPTASGDEEESIEQYMAKLMKRVRGESATQVSSPPTARQPSTVQNDVKEPASSLPRAAGQDATSSASEASAQVDPVAENEQKPVESPVDWEAIARRAVAAAPKADMGALRALANESARRAISRSELRRHRRDAVTKVIVSTLAGMTSLWLMLDSPSYRDIQFIAACVALVAAAYWAGETYREMLESLRAAAYDRPKTADDDEDSDGDQRLPIDAEDE